MNVKEILRDHPIFVCGHPKSGTTLLVSLLDSHPQLLVYPNETFFFRGFVPEMRKRDLDEKISLGQRYLLHYFERELIHPEGQNSEPATQVRVFEDYAKTCQEMANLLETQGVRHDGDLLSAAVIAYAHVHEKVSQGTRYWVEKTPYNEHFAHSMFNWWPEARCIHIVRDPRDNYLTYRRKHPGLSAVDFSVGWNSSLKVGIQNQEKYGQDRYLILRYEDLTVDTEMTLQKLVGFLGIVDDKVLRIPTSEGIPWEGNSQFDDKFQGISSKPVGRWKRELDEHEAAIIESMCADYMRRERYEFEKKSSMNSLIHLWRWRVKQIPALRSDISRMMKQRFGMLPN